jgi:ABC-type nickel/cobalt efflux system permease component RcnA
VLLREVIHLFRLVNTFILYRIAIVFAIFLAVEQVSAAGGPPFTGTVQKTVVSEHVDAVRIEYSTRFGPEIIPTLNLDRDGDGLLDESERSQFLDTAHRLLFANVVCRLGEKTMPLSEIARNLAVAEDGDYKNGIDTVFIWRVPLGQAGEKQATSLRISDHNFEAGDTNRLTYYVAVLDTTGSIRLADQGRELVLGLSDRAVAATENSRPQSGRVEAEPEADSLIAFLQDESGGFGLYLFGLFTAFVLGAFHALSPGHGKAMVAAYLIGTRGRIIDAVRLGVVVTVTHMISVVALGAVALILSHYTVSRDFYPWLGVASGGLIFLTGYFLLARIAVTANHGHHHDHPHLHEHHHEHGSMPAGNSLKEILSLGVAGGLVPCPSAIVILLFAIAVNRIVTGLLLILSFSLGLAAVLILIGIMTITASNRLERFSTRLGWLRRLPVFTAGIIMILGVAIGLNALLHAGILSYNP